MKFSARGEYGVRVMVELARRYGEGPLPLTELADHEGLPLPYLEQIIADLRQGGLVTARRGRRGGYTLTRPPAEISMSQVVRLLEGGISPMICIPDDSQPADAVLCARQDYCTTRVLWLRVRDGIVAALEATTLADLAPSAAVTDERPRVPLHLALGLGGDRNECHDMVAIEHKTC